MEGLISLQRPLFGAGILSPKNKVIDVLKLLLLHISPSLCLVILSFKNYARIPGNIVDVAEFSGVVVVVEISVEVFVCVLDVVETVDAKFSVVDFSVCIIQF